MFYRWEWLGWWQPILGGDDCNDEDANTYPTAAHKEEYPLNEQCVRDGDGDGLRFFLEGQTAMTKIQWNTWWYR